MVYLKSLIFNSLFYLGTGFLVIIMGPVLFFPSRYARACPAGLYDLFASYYDRNNANCGGDGTLTGGFFMR